MDETCDNKNASANLEKKGTKSRTAKLREKKKKIIQHS